jgi:hypothetical protein
MEHRGRTSPIPTILGVPLALMAAAALRVVILSVPAFAEFQLFPPASAFSLDARGPETLFLAGPAIHALVLTLLACAVFWPAAAILGLLIRRGWSLGVIRAAYVAVFLAGLVFAYAVFAVGPVLAEAYEQANPDARDAALKSFQLKCHYLSWALPFCLLAAGMLVLSWRRETMGLYNLPGERRPAAGDRLLENIRTGGRDPRYRKSWLSSALLHWFLIVALPFLLLFRGCVEPYLVPYGRGQASLTRVMRVVKRRKAKRKKYILRKDAAVYWDIPDLNESKVARQVDEDTQLTHVADRSAVHGKMGAGGGQEGGWPDGVPGGKIRFIRLEYRGRDWDDGMDARTRADLNFLDFLRREVPFPVARKSESHPIRLLKRYPKGFAPPFVYMTGSEHIDVSRSDQQVLREYLLDGGMLFADAGSSRWDRSFRSFIQSVWPDKRLIDVADDDEIFQMPYAFANGAPPLWHHGGLRAMGVKHRGRWVVFYHPGDVNDAWKTGHSGMDPEIADKAFQMGINVMYYAITRYLQLTRKYRKP